MSLLKNLAGQTAVYGLSSIIGRILTYLLVPLYTRVFAQGEYGIVIVLFGYVGFVFALLTYGMETSFFRYSELNTDKKKVFNTTIFSLLITTFVFLILALSFSSDIAQWIEYPDYQNYVVLMALILALDTLTAIPFAKLRAQNRPGRFATIKLVNIGLNIGLNLFFYLVCPFVIKNFSEGALLNLVNFLYQPEQGIIIYVFISNLVASGVTLLMLLPEFLSFNFLFDYKLWKQMIVYALPLLFTGLAAIMNEVFGRVSMKYILPEDIAEQQVGIYSASYKIAILMSLFIQAFRYAAEPFFFAQEKKKNAKASYAMVMKYFVICIAFVFLGIMMYLDLIILMVGKNFREGIAVIPYLLMAYLFLGVFYNLSVWYKLTNKTKFGAYLAIGGAVITIVFNFLWIPTFGYIGSAWATLLCFSSMMIASYLIGRKHFDVPYDLKRIIAYIGIAFVLYKVSTYFQFENMIAQLSFNTIFILIYLGCVYLLERKNFKAEIST